MDNKISINEVMEEVKRMEDELIKERKESGERRESLFSHYLYERRVREYQENRIGNEEEILLKRLDDVIHQHQINMDDEAYGEMKNEWSSKTIEKAEKWKSMLVNR